MIEPFIGFIFLKKGRGRQKTGLYQWYVADTVWAMLNL